MVRQMVGPWWRVLAACLLGIFGCSEAHRPIAEQELYQVSGQVTQGGKPIERLIVLYLPIHGGLRAKGITSQTGRYSLLNESEVPGVPAGEYRVVFQPVRAPGDKPSGSSQVDEVYQSFETSPVEVVIAGDASQMNFDVKYPRSR